jgi:peroxiredoxin
MASGPPPGERLPYFELPDSRGGTSGPQRYRGRRILVLAFVADGACAPCLDLLRQFKDTYADLAEEEAEVLAVARLDQPRARRLAEELRLPFPVLADPQGAAHARYGAKDLAVYVADRYGEVQERWLTNGDRSALPSQKDVFERVRFIALQCPE